MIGPQVPIDIVKEIADPLESEIIQIKDEYESFFEENNAITWEVFRLAKL